MAAGSEEQHVPKEKDLLYMSAAEFAVFLNLAAMPFGFLVVTNAYKNDVSRVFRHNTLVVLTHDLTYCR